jgi:hypothetical protein
MRAALLARFVFFGAAALLVCQGFGAGRAPHCGTPQLLLIGRGTAASGAPKRHDKASDNCSGRGSPAKDVVSIIWTLGQACVLLLGTARALLGKEGDSIRRHTNCERKQQENVWRVELMQQIISV